jgi:hypothetical protein
VVVAKGREREREGSETAQNKQTKQKHQRTSLHDPEGESVMEIELDINKKGAVRSLLT